MKKLILLAIALCALLLAGCSNGGDDSSSYASLNSGNFSNNNTSANGTAGTNSAPPSNETSGNTAGTGNTSTTLDNTENENKEPNDNIKDLGVFTQSIFRQLCIDSGKDYKTIKYFEIPVGYTSIENGSTIEGLSVDDGTGVFSGCENLINVVIPDTVKYIGRKAFCLCKKLYYISIPDSVTTIGKWAFYGCFELTDLYLGKSIKYIEDYAFYQCRKLYEVEIPDSVISIGQKAFDGCTSLEKFKIGKNVSSIGNAVTAFCAKLSKIELSNENRYFYENDGILFSYDKTKLLIYPSGRDSNSYTTPSKVKTIADYAFLGAENLKYVYLDSDVTYIGEYAFNSCFKLLTVYAQRKVDAPKLGGSGNNIFWCVENNFRIYVPKDSYDRYKASWRNYSAYIHKNY